MTDANPDLSVLIVTLDGWALAERAIASVMAQDTARCRVEVVVVDNGSTDGTETALPARFPAARYLRLERNFGFAVANNRGLTLCRAPLVLLLNNDAVAADGALRALLEAAERYPGFDLFAPQMIRMAQPTRVDNRGIFLDATGHWRQLDAGRPVVPERSGCEVFGPSGGAAMIRRPLPERIGLFDEALETFLEDADFAARARATGARCLYVPGARILHAGSATASRLPDRKLYFIQRNLRVLRRRWLEARPWSPTFWLAHAYEWYQVAKAFRSGQLGTVRRAMADARTLRSDAERWATGEAQRRVAAWLGVRSRPL